MAEEDSTETGLEFYQTVLNKCRRKFVEDLDPDSLLDVFVEKDFITNTKERDIRELDNTSYRNRQILEIVRSKSENDYIKFKVYLIKSRQEHLVEHLEATEVKLRGTTIGDIQTRVRNKGYTCSVCDLSYESVDLLVKHTKSQEHLDVIERQQKFAKEAEENVEESNEDSSDLSDLSNSFSEENICDSIEQVDKCYICDVSFTSPSHANSHLSGKPHKKRKAQFDMRNQPSVSSSDPSGSCQIKGELDNQPDSSIFAVDKTSHSTISTVLTDEHDRNRFCEICKVPFSGIENAKQHYESDKHKKKSGILEKEKKGQALPLQCDICKVNLSGQESALAHFSSYKHKKKANTSPMESSSLSCNLCNCSFSGPENAAAHYESDKHKKRELKAKSEESKESLPMSCKICNCQFTGEDNAKQHFDGRKHKKALRLYGENSLKVNDSSQVESKLSVNDSNSTAQNGDDEAAQNDVITTSQNNDNSMTDTDVTDAADADETEQAHNGSFEDDISEDIERLLLGETEDG